MNNQAGQSNTLIGNHNTLESIATALRQQDKKYTLLFAYNGTGKTRLSMQFKDMGKQGQQRDTLYFNAFTEDLFTWDNDFENDSVRKLKMNLDSRFFKGLQGLAIEKRIFKLLSRYVNFEFKIDYEKYEIIFQSGKDENKIENIKISRGEENIFIWCFFLTIAQLAIEENDAYKWVKRLYIDDPISSLDEQNAIAIAHFLAEMLKSENNKLKTVISTHHSLFYNVLHNELGNSNKLFVYKNNNNYTVTSTTDTPNFYHLSVLAELKKANDTQQLYTYHFSMLRSIIEKTATFFGEKGFKECLTFIKDKDEAYRTRVISILNHGNYSLFEPIAMIDNNKELFSDILNEFLKKYPFNLSQFEDNTT